MAQEDSTAIDPYEHYGLVVYIADRIARSHDIGQHREDLIQEGFCGLLEASPRYDPAHGVEVSTFVAFRIWGAIYDSLRKLPLVKVPRERHQELRDVDRAREQLEQRLGRFPTQEELAAALGTTPARLQDIERARIQIVSSDPTAQRDEAPTPEDAVAIRQRRTRKALLLVALEACIVQLPFPQRELWLLRKAQPPLTVEQRGELVGLAEAVARQEERRARAQIKTCLAQKGWTAEAVAEVWREDVGA